ncbi:uncharacterized protein PAF06_016055 [Gastrophryne carolinensis]
MVQQRALEESSRRLTAQLEVTQEEQRKDRETLKVVLQQLASVTERAPGVADATQASIRASHFLQKMTTADDVEAYLTTFERTAERECWPKEQWAGLLAPFLSGEPQKAYFDLETQDAMDYGKLKKEILTRLGVTVSVRAQRVHTWVYSMDKPPRSQMHDLIHLTKKWLQPEVLTGPQMVERVVMNQYLRSLPVTLRKWVSHGDPKDADQMVEMRIGKQYGGTHSLNYSTQAPRRLIPKFSFAGIWFQRELTASALTLRNALETFIYICCIIIQPNQEIDQGDVHAPDRGQRPRPPDDVEKSRRESEIAQDFRMSL